MKNPIFHIVFKGVLVGACVGLVIGVYASQLTLRRVIKKEDYSHPIHYENAQMRYTSAMRGVFVFICGFCGPFIAAASFGEWIRSAVYGTIGCLALFVCFIIVVSLVNSAVSGVPVLASLKFPSPAVRMAQHYGVPAAFLLGPIIGVTSWRIRGNRQSSAA